jgi:hypothetical protein
MKKEDLEQKDLNTILGSAMNPMVCHTLTTDTAFLNDFLTGEIDQLDDLENAFDNIQGDIRSGTIDTAFIIIKVTKAENESEDEENSDEENSDDPDGA